MLAANGEGANGADVKPRLGTFVVAGGGLVADDGVAATGAAPLLNSAQRGHLRFVSGSPSTWEAEVEMKTYSYVPFGHNGRNDVLYRASLGDPKS